MAGNPLASVDAYETFVYGLPDAFPCIQMSTLVVASIGPATAVVSGEVHFGQGLFLRVLEVVDFRQRRLNRYGYELWKGNEESGGTTRGPTLICPNCAARILITSTSRLTSNTIECRLPA